VTTGVEPIYTDMPGWDAASANGRLPDTLERYIATIEQAVSVPISIVSLGPDRTETVMRQPMTAA